MGQRHRALKAYKNLPPGEQLRIGALAVDVNTFIPDGDFSRYDTLSLDEQATVDSWVTTICMAVDPSIPGRIVIPAVAREFAKNHPE